MKRLKNIFCMLILFAMSMGVFACKASPSDVKISFDSLKGLVEISEDVSNWQGLRIQSLNANNEEIASFQSNKEVARHSDKKVDFVHEKKGHKVYCEDNVRYYCEETRKYVDESDFDYDEYEEEILDEYLQEIDNFFEEKNNSKYILMSDKSATEDSIIYTFELGLDKENSKVLVATYTLDKNGKLISINFSIKINGVEDNKTEIKENTEIVVTPEWFKSNDYMKEITYEEIRAVVFDDNLFDGWSSAYIKDEIVHNLGRDDENYKYNEFYLSKETVGSDVKNKVIQLNATDKSYTINGLEYVYKNGVAEEVIERNNSYDFNNRIKSLFASFFQFSFKDGETMERYYTHSRKYEKDRTIIAFRLFDDASTNPNIERDEEAYGALYFDLDGNFYMADFRMVAKITGYEEKHITIKKMNSPINEPEWFDIEDFN